MWDDAGPVRDAPGLLRLIDWLDDRPASNAVTVAQMIARSALAREETRGAHVRLDHPDEDPAYLRHLPCPELQSTV
jgi:L-aspartate oxidase